MHEKDNVTRTARALKEKVVKGAASIKDKLHNAIKSRRERIGQEKLLKSDLSGLAAAVKGEQWGQSFSAVKSFDYSEGARLDTARLGYADPRRSLIAAIKSLKKVEPWIKRTNQASFGVKEGSSPVMEVGYKPPVQEVDATLPVTMVDGSVVTIGAKDSVEDMSVLDTSALEIKVKVPGEKGDSVIKMRYPAKTGEKEPGLLVFIPNADGNDRIAVWPETYVFAYRVITGFAGLNHPKGWGGHTKVVAPEGIEADKDAFAEYGKTEA